MKTNIKNNPRETVNFWHALEKSKEVKTWE
jgi:hypothetical protein